MALKPKLPKIAGRAAGRVPASNSSYQAQGLAQAPQLDSEIGSSQPVTIREIVPELASSFSRLTTFSKMMNDAGVDVSMRAAKTPVLGADYFVEPYSNSDQDVLIADFVEGNLLGGMSAPFLNSIEDILHMYEDGYSVLEKVYVEQQWSSSQTGANAKTYTMLKKLGIRHPTTIIDIEYDNNGGPVRLTQNAIQADKNSIQKPIDFTKLLIFTFGKRGGDLTGRSLLRTAYPHWFYKTHMYKVDAIQKERHSLGIPIGKLLPGHTDADKVALRAMLRAIHANEEQFMVIPPSIEVEFAEIHGHLVNSLDSAKEHNVMILMNVMAQFLALGFEGSGGGRATGGSQTDIFMKALRYVANYIAEVINMYLIPELVIYNFPTTNFPKLRVRNIGETRDLQMLGSALASLFSQSAITNTLETENWTRKIFDMPLITQQDFDAAQAALAASASAGTIGGGSPSQNGKTGNKNTPTSPGYKGKPPNAPQ